MRRFVFVLLLGAAAAQERPPALVVVADAVEQEVTARRSFVGSVEAVRKSTVESEVEGLVEEYLAEEGQRVEAGAPLAKLRTRLAAIALDAAKAELKLRTEELRELKNGSRPEELAQARARFASANAANDLRQWRLGRAKQLFETSVISEDELKEAQMTARLAEELLAEVQEGLRLAEAGPREEKIAQAEAKVESQQAEVARLEDNLERHTIRAPFAGYVVKKHTEVGEWLGKGAAVAQMVALDEVDVVAQVVEDYILGVQVGMDATVSIGALPGREFPGKVFAIVPGADERARTFPVKVRLKNPDGPLLKAGMFATVFLPVGGTEKAVLVPKDAIVLGGPSPMVYVVLENKAVPMPVQIGTAVGELVQVKGGVVGGQKVVVRGNERLQPNQPVRTEAN
ncbi:MAG TPA: efflux RND transporter periplasmic adaptor subunit [Planctomycetota bacterium]|nr:efflux RND transporter periplasmic adaptor subunit [Planctomycetota bacterium]